MGEDTLCSGGETQEPPGSSDFVAGDLITFNDNGGWCWYQDERVIVDAKGGKLVIGSVASGGSREAHVEIVVWDFATRNGVLSHVGTMSYCDDHDAPAIVQRPDGNYAAMWAGHNNDCNSYTSTYDGTGWATQRRFDWTSFGCPASGSKTITYSNMWYMDGNVYSLVRSIETSPNVLVSKTDGASWEFGGRLTSTPTIGYVAGYYKYWGNNVDRIDFLGTEAHPRDNDNSLYHGYIKDGKVYNSTGVVVDNNILDTSAKNITEYTKVFKTRTQIDGLTLEHAWNADLVRYEDGTIAAIWTARVSGTGADDPDKRLLYARFDGSSWKLTHLAKAGTKLYASEQDYTGLGALDPDDSRIIYISTPYDPSNESEDSFYGNKEIYKGITCDDGKTFRWEAITHNSTMDNLRPVVPKWDADHTALLWLRGRYTSAQSYDFDVVGLVDGL